MTTTEQKTKTTKEKAFEVITLYDELTAIYERTEGLTAVMTHYLLDTLEEKQLAGLSWQIEENM